MCRHRVALRKESVDRKAGREAFRASATVSLSARRAWIENGVPAIAGAVYIVALRKESVDRNWSQNCA
mgnify:CR=1 FL=1